MGVRSCPVGDPHTQIAAGLEQLVILPRVTFVYRIPLTWSHKSEFPQNGDASGAVGAAQIDYSRARGRSISVAWSHDEPHDQSDQDEEQHAHSRPSERTHSVSKATHHGELLLHLPATSRTRPVSRPGAVFAARNRRSPLTDRDTGRPKAAVSGGHMLR